MTRRKRWSYICTKPDIWWQPQFRMAYNFLQTQCEGIHGWGILQSYDNSRSNSAEFWAEWVYCITQIAAYMKVCIATGILRVWYSSRKGMSVVQYAFVINNLHLRFVMIGRDMRGGQITYERSQRRTKMAETSVLKILGNVIASAFDENEVTLKNIKNS